jgi:hypothetical protein
MLLVTDGKTDKNCGQKHEDVSLQERNEDFQKAHQDSARD